MRHFPRVFLLLSTFISVHGQAAPIYLSPSNGYPSGEYPAEWLEKRTTDVKTQKWLRLRTKMGILGWTSEETVVSKTNLLGRAVILSTEALMAAPAFKSEHKGTLTAGEFVTALEERAGFLKVRTVEGASGFIRRASVLTGADLQEKEVIFMNDGLILRSSSSPLAHELGRSKKFQRAKVIESSFMRWGRVEVEGKGSVWWPLDEKPNLNSKTEWQKLSSNELFLKKKIFDLAASPTVPTLRFASASGVFRSIDDQQWEKIPKFGEQNHPIAIASSGRVFVGSWYSDDHGETFNSYVRFDQLVSSLKSRWQMNPYRIKILEIKPLNNNGSELMLRVDVGLKKPVEALTKDHGITWKAI